MTESNTQEPLTLEQVYKIVIDWLETPTVQPYEYDMTVGQSFENIIKKHLFERTERTGAAVLSPSSLGKCTRQLAYAYHGFPKAPLKYNERLTFLTGSLLELVLYIVFEAAGVPIQDQQKELTIGDIVGTTDGTLCGYVVDLKSMSKASFEIAVRDGVSNDFGYLTQMQLYKVGLNSRKGVFIGINKNTGEIALFEAEDRPVLVEIASTKRKIVIESSPDKLPARDFALEVDPKTKKMRLPMQCKFCSYKEHCWEIVEVVKGYNNSDQYISSGPK